MTRFSWLQGLRRRVCEFTNIKMGGGVDFAGGHVVSRTKYPPPPLKSPRLASC